MLFPCTFHGLLTLSLSWTLLEIPLDLAGLVSLTEMHYKMDAQFINLCIANRAASLISVSECVREINSRLDEMVTQRCGNLAATEEEKKVQGESGGAGGAAAEKESLHWFRRKVASALELRTNEWTSQDLRLDGWVPGSHVDPLDHCGAVWGSSSPGSQHEEVLVVGQFLAIDRDFLLRDVLGCIPRVRYCVTSEEDRRKAWPMLEYETRKRQAAWEKWGIRTNASIDECEPPSSRQQFQYRNHQRVVLVRNLNRWGDPINAHEGEPVKNILEPLLDLWRPAVFIHLSEEVARDPSDELEAAYSKAGLVLRPYYHHHSPEFKSMLHRLRDKVIILPLGYGQGSYDATGTLGQAKDGEESASQPNLYRSSGVTAALAWVLDDDNEEAAGFTSNKGAHILRRDHTWAFVGRLGVHGSRAAMSNVFSNAPSNWGPHIRIVDKGGAFAGGDNPVVTPAQVAFAYQRSLFVPSPPGNSPDCFRTYEAVVNGAIPLLDGRPTDYVWWRSYYGNRTCQIDQNVNGLGCAGASGDESASGQNDGNTENRSNLSDGIGLGPFPAPLGFAFAWEDEESTLERHARDEAGFDQVLYAKVRRRPGIIGGGNSDDESAWRSLLERALRIGHEERILRRDLNARWYVGTLTEIRRKVQEALVHCPAV